MNSFCSAGIGADSLKSIRIKLHRPSINEDENALTSWHLELQAFHPFKFVNQDNIERVVAMGLKAFGD